MNKHDLGHGLHAEVFVREAPEYLGYFSVAIALPAPGDALHSLLLSTAPLLGESLLKHWGQSAMDGRGVRVHETTAMSRELAEATETDAIRLLREVVKENAGDFPNEPDCSVDIGAGLRVTFMFTGDNWVTVRLLAVTGVLHPKLRDDTVELLGERLSEVWGKYVYGSGSRQRHVELTGPPKSFMDDVVKTLRGVTAKNQGQTAEGAL